MTPLKTWLKSLEKYQENTAYALPQVQSEEMDSCFGSLFPYYRKLNHVSCLFYRRYKAKDKSTCAGIYFRITGKHQHLLYSKYRVKR